MPSAGGECPGFTIIPHDNHFHNPKAAQSSCSEGLWWSRYVRCVCALYNPNRDPSTSALVSAPPAFRKPAPMRAHVVVLQEKCLFQYLILQTSWVFIIIHQIYVHLEKNYILFNLYGNSIFSYERLKFFGKYIVCLKNTLNEHINCGTV